MTTNTPAPAQEAAIQESERNAAVEEYFGHRAWIKPTASNFRLFEAGFDRAYALLSKLRAPVADERAAFEAFQREAGVDELYLERHATSGHYMWTATKENWETWQARAALASAPVAGEAQPVAWFRKTDITEWTDTEPETDGWTPLYEHAAPQASEADPSVPSWANYRQGLVDGKAGGDGAVRNAALNEAVWAVGALELPVGNSPAGELAAKWTEDKLREAMDAIRALKGDEPSEVVRGADVFVLLAFIFERFGRPCDAGDLPDSVVAAVRRLERAVLSAQPANEPANSRAATAADPRQAGGSAQSESGNVGVQMKGGA